MGITAKTCAWLVARPIPNKTRSCRKTGRPAPHQRRRIADELTKNHLFSRFSVLEMLGIVRHSLERYRYRLACSQLNKKNWPTLLLRKLQTASTTGPIAMNPSSVILDNAHYYFQDIDGIIYSTGVNWEWNNDKHIDTYRVDRIKKQGSRWLAIRRYRSETAAFATKNRAIQWVAAKHQEHITAQQHKTC